MTACPPNGLCPVLARDLVRAFVGARYMAEEWHMRRLAKVAARE